MSYTNEAGLQTHIIRKFRKQYPGIHYRSDWFAGHYCPPHIKEQFNNAQSGSGYPDLHIIHNNGLYASLYIEVKLDTVFLKDGVTLKYNAHLWEQYLYLEYLKAQGFAAVFGCGEQHIDNIIQAYMDSRPIFQNIKAAPYINKHRAASDKAAKEFQRKYDLDNPE